ncbi:MAG: DUF4350 domain-containing protein [Gammaproteobacteria bacterium]|nr:DUF4350 domain-containing protein [Gammaproteobacteria bacterium]
MNGWLPRAAWALLVLAVLGYLAWHFDPHQRSVRVGYSGEAGHDGLYAARKLLLQLGVDAGTPTLDDWLLALDSPREVVLLGSGFALRRETRVRRVLAWVAQGGHLLLQPQHVVGPNLNQRDALDLAEQFGVRLVDSRDSPLRVADELVDAERSGSWDDDELASQELSYVELVGTRDILAIEISRADRLSLHGADVVGTETGAQVIARDLLGAVAVRVAHGAGRITFLLSTGPFHNPRLQRLDHAQFLYRLVTDGYAGGSVLMVDRNETVAWLPVLIWHRAPQVVLCAALLIVIGIWSRLRRLGPALAPPPAEARGLTDQLRALGRLVWRSGDEAFLLAGMQRGLVQRIERRVPGWGRLSEPEATAAVARLCDMEPGVVRTALADIDDIDVHEDRRAAPRTARERRRQALVIRVRALEMIRRRV